MLYPVYFTNDDSEEISTLRKVCDSVQVFLTMIGFIVVIFAIGVGWGAYHYHDKPLNHIHKKHKIP